MPRVERATRLRVATVSRAEAALDRLRRRELLHRTLQAWREPAWRGRRELRRALNVVQFRQATRFAESHAIRACFAAWARLWPERPPGLSVAPAWPQYVPLRLEPRHGPIGAGGPAMPQFQ